MEEGEEHGREVERQTWISSDHGVGQCAPITKPQSFVSTVLQTDDPIIASAGSSDSNIQPTGTHWHTSVSTQTSTNSKSHLDTLIQATESFSSLSQPQKASAAPLDWAEDTESLSIAPIPPSLPVRQLRDLSALRSSKSNPFSSLQHCSKHFSRHSHQAHCRQFCFNFNPYPPHRNSFKQSQPHFHIKTHSHLNWESDPRLSDLSRSLKALGWICAS